MSLTEVLAAAKCGMPGEELVAVVGLDVVAVAVVVVEQLLGIMAMVILCPEQQLRRHAAVIIQLEALQPPANAEQHKFKSQLYKLITQQRQEIIVHTCFLIKYYPQTCISVVFVCWAGAIKAAVCCAASGRAVLASLSATGYSTTKHYT